MEVFLSSYVYDSGVAQAPQVIDEQFGELYIFLAVVLGLVFLISVIIGAYVRRRRGVRKQI